mmetsp:Transcript_2532/g.7154  ORF Transcript_2532/g.7154 Transcript_2532/m.7154 type:complete len:97 (-) Transcript_2532:7292-7582(-)
MHAAQRLDASLWSNGSSIAASVRAMASTTRTLPGLSPCLSTAARTSERLMQLSLQALDTAGRSCPLRYGHIVFAIAKLGGLPSESYFLELLKTLLG